MIGHIVWKKNVKGCSLQTAERGESEERLISRPYLPDFTHFLVNSGSLGTP